MDLCALNSTLCIEKKKALSKHKLTMMDGLREIVELEITTSGNFTKRPITEIMMKTCNPETRLSD